MSGIITYFRAFMPSDQTTQRATTTTAEITATKSSEKTTNENEPLNDYDDDDDDDYHTSLATTIKSLDSVSKNNETNDDDNGLLNINEGYNNSNNNNNNNNNDINPQDSENDFTPPDPPYHPPHLSPPTTSPPLIPLPPPPNPTLLLSPSSLIPSASRVTNSSYSLVQPSLKFRIRLMTSLRNIDRMNHWSTKTTTNDGSRIDCEYDGPFSQLYNEVVSLRLCSHEFGWKAREEMSETGSNIVVMLYLYDEYARGWNAIEKLSNRPCRPIMRTYTPFLVSFRHIPERCVSEGGGGVIVIGIGGEMTKGSMDERKSYDDESLEIYWHDKTGNNYRMGWKGAVTEIGNWFHDDQRSAIAAKGEKRMTTTSAEMASEKETREAKKLRHDGSASKRKEVMKEPDRHGDEDDNSDDSDSDDDYHDNDNVPTKNDIGDDSANSNNGNDHRKRAVVAEGEERMETTTTVEKAYEEEIREDALCYDGPAINRWEEGNNELEYKTLSELSQIVSNNSSFNNHLYYTMGLIVGFGQPCLTKRDDWMISLAIIDQSLHPYDHTCVIMNIFEKEKEKLLLICEMGDVIVCNRVKIQLFHDELQLYNNQRNSSFLTIHTPTPSRLTLHTTPHQRTYTLSPHTTHLISSLHTWGNQTRLPLYPTINTNLRFTISQMGLPEDDGAHAGVTGDVTVVVTGIVEYKGRREGTDPYGFLRVWDGTGPSVVDRHPITKAFIEGNDPNETVVQSIADIVKLHNKNINTANNQEQQPQRPSNFTPPTHLLGHVVNVAIWEEPMWRFITNERRISLAAASVEPPTTFLTRGGGTRTTVAAPPTIEREEYHGHSTVYVGRFVRLRNVKDGNLRPTTGEENASINLRCLIVHSKSWITPLPPTSPDIIDRLFDHHRRMNTNGEPLNLQSGVLPPSPPRQEEETLGNGSNVIVTTVPHPPPPPTPIATRSKSHTNEELYSVAECLGAVVTSPPTSFWVRFKIKDICPSIDEVVEMFLSRRQRKQQQQRGKSSRKRRRRGVNPCRFLIEVFDHTADISVVVQNGVADGLLLGSLSSSSSSSSSATPTSEKSDGTNTNDNNNNDMERKAAKESLEQLLQRRGVWESRVRGERAGNVKYFVLERLLWEEEGGNVTYVL